MSIEEEMASKVRRLSDDALDKELSFAVAFGPEVHTNAQAWIDALTAEKRSRTKRYVAIQVEIPAWIVVDREGGNDGNESWATPVAFYLETDEAEQGFQISDSGNAFFCEKQADGWVFKFDADDEAIATAREPIGSFDTPNLEVRR